MRERALREMGLAPGWVRRDARASAKPTAQGAFDPTPMHAFSSVQVEDFDLLALSAAIEQCQACPRALTRTRAVPGEGPAQVRLLVIDDVPSQADASQGALRDTEGARLFDQLLFFVGLKREAIFLSHALRCDGSPPNESETLCCAPYLKREIELLSPRALLALGSGAAEAIRANAWSGALHVFVVPHPHELVGDAAKKRAAWATLRDLRTFLAGS